MKWVAHVALRTSWGLRGIKSSGNTYSGFRGRGDSRCEDREPVEFGRRSEVFEVATWAVAGEGTYFAEKD